MSSGLKKVHVIRLDESTNWADAKSVIDGAWVEMWYVPEDCTVTEWTEKYLNIPSGTSPQPGAYRVSRTPWSEEIMNAWSDDDTEMVVFMSSTQASKTQIMLNCMAYSVSEEDSNIIVCFPNETGAKGLSDERWCPTVDATPALKKLKPAKADRFKKLSQYFTNGVNVNFVNAGSPTNLASRPAGRIMADEIDKYDGGDDGSSTVRVKKPKKEAPALELLLNRTKAYKMLGQLIKVFLASTPTLESGQIWMAYIKGTMEEYNLKCQNSGCEGMFYPVFREHVRFPAEGTIKERAAAVKLVCPHCHFEHGDLARRKAAMQGKWVQTAPESVGKKVRSFRFNEIISCPELEELCEKYLTALKILKETGATGPLQDLINSSFAEIWSDKVYRSRSYDHMLGNIGSLKRSAVPKDAVALTCGIDTQKDGFYYETRAWMRETITQWDEEGEDFDTEHNVSYVIDNGFVATFADLKKIVIDDEYFSEDGSKYKIELALMDSGGEKTKDVYRFCVEHHPIIIATRGMRGRSGKPYFETPVKIDGFEIPSLNVNTHFWKDVVAVTSRREAGKDCCIYYHKTIEDDYFKQINSEYKDERGDWVCPSGVDNHYFDTAVLNHLAADIRRVIHRDPQKDEQDAAIAGQVDKSEEDVRTFGIKTDY